MLFLAIFATALMIPLGFLANHVYNQFEEEMFYEYKWNAEKFVKLKVVAPGYKALKPQYRGHVPSDLTIWVRNYATDNHCTVRTVWRWLKNGKRGYGHGAKSI